MKDKEDILIVVMIVVSLAALTILAHITGAKEATLNMEKQAIANGAATYNKEGELVWIKKQ